MVVAAGIGAQGVAFWGIVRGLCAAGWAGVLLDAASLRVPCLSLDPLLLLPLCAVTGQTVYVDNGLSIMGLAGDSKTLDRANA